MNTRLPIHIRNLVLVLAILAEGCHIGCEGIISMNQESDHIEGVIVEKTIRKYYKNDPMIVVLQRKTGRTHKFGFYGKDTTGMYKVVREGDSLFKPKGTLIFSIFREDTTFEYDLLQDCEKSR